MCDCVGYPLQLNPGRQGFYRVSYSTDLFSALLPALRDGSLPPQDRLGILNDAFALVRALYQCDGCDVCEWASLRLELGLEAP